MFCGKDQIVFLHGDTLARYDMKANKEIWSRHLVDPKHVVAEVNKEIKEIQSEIDYANNHGGEWVPKMPSREKLTKQVVRATEAQFELRVHGQNIWVASDDKLMRYDWETGKLIKEMAM